MSRWQRHLWMPPGVLFLLTVCADPSTQQEHAAATEPGARLEGAWVQVHPWLGWGDTMVLASDGTVSGPLRGLGIASPTTRKWYEGSSFSPDDLCIARHCMAWAVRNDTLMLATEEQTTYIRIGSGHPIGPRPDSGVQLHRAGRPTPMSVGKEAGVVR